MEQKGWTHPYSREKIREIVAFWKSGKKRRPFKSVQHKYRKVSSTSILYRWEKQIQEGEQNVKKYHLV